MLTFARKTADRDPVCEAMWGTDVEIDVIPVVFVFFMFLSGSFLQWGHPKGGGDYYFLALTCVRIMCVSTNSLPSALISTTDPQFLSSIFESPAHEVNPSGAANWFLSFVLRRKYVTTYNHALPDGGRKRGY